MPWKDFKGTWEDFMCFERGILCFVKESKSIRGRIYGVMKSFVHQKESEMHEKMV